LRAACDKDAAETGDDRAIAHAPYELTGFCASVMIEKFASIGSTVVSEFLDLNHTS